MTGELLLAKTLFGELCKYRDKFAGFAGDLEKNASALSEKELYTAKLGAYLYDNLDDIYVELKELTAPYEAGFIKAAQAPGVYAAGMTTPRDYSATTRFYNPAAAALYNRYAAPAIGSPVSKHVMPTYEDLIHKLIGGKWGTAASIGSYFIPGVYTAASGYDALANFANMFGKNLTWKQRLGSGLSGLANAAFAAMGLVPGGGLLAKGLKFGGKRALGGLAKLMGSGTIGKGLSAASRGLRLGGVGVDRAKKAYKAWSQAGHGLAKPFQYIRGLTPTQQKFKEAPGVFGVVSPWAKTTKNIWTSGFGDIGAQAGLGQRIKNTLGHIGTSPITGIYGMPVIPALAGLPMQE